MGWALQRRGPALLQWPPPSPQPLPALITRTIPTTLLALWLQIYFVPWYWKIVWFIGILLWTPIGECVVQNYGDDDQCHCRWPLPRPNAVPGVNHRFAIVGNAAYTILFPVPGSLTMFTVAWTMYVLAVRTLAHSAGTHDLALVCRG